MEYFSELLSSNDDGDNNIVEEQNEFTEAIEAMIRRKGKTARSGHGKI